MILGNGLISNIFKDVKHDDVILFASGVSNSLEDRETEYKRELDLIESLKDTDLKFIYFSTVSINNKRRYFEHKRQVELFITSYFKNYIIFRLPNLIGKGGNKLNIYNNLKSKIINNESIIVYDIYKSFLDVDDMKLICLECLKYNKIILNICYIEKIKLTLFISLIMKKLNKTTNINIVYNYEEVLLDNSKEINEVIKSLNLNKECYTKNLIDKYTIE
jgi:nucleoside-diphosphate-sugar epimerase